MGGRAERNEYLLLHAFNQAGYVVPNKYQPDFKKKKINGVENVAEDDNKLSRNRKAQYMGGLVLEPKIGLNLLSFLMKLRTLCGFFRPADCLSQLTMSFVLKFD